MVKDPTVKVLSLPSRHPYMSKFNDGIYIKFIDPESDLFSEGKCDPEYLKINFPADTYDIVHIHFSFDRVPIDLLENVLIYFKEIKKPIVWTTHSLESLRIKDYGGGKYQQLLFNYSDKIISPTEGCKSLILEKFGKHTSDVSVIPLGYMANPLDVARIYKSVKKDSNLFTILIGDFRENKEIFQSVINFLQCKDLEKAKLQLIYKPINLYRDNWQDINSQMIEFYKLTQNHRVKSLSLPNIPNDLITESFLKSHAVILPYKWGTHSGQVELAKDCGCHVVSTNVGFFKEQNHNINTWDISDNNFEKFPGRYTNCLIDVYNKKSLEPAGLTRSKELKNLIEMHLSIYKKLLNIYRTK
jgi:glycosyltransferase involved in cell wall biosynthesis